MRKCANSQKRRASKAGDSRENTPAKASRDKLRRKHGAAPPSQVKRNIFASNEGSAAAATAAWDIEAELAASGQKPFGGAASVFRSSGKEAKKPAKTEKHDFSHLFQ